MYLTYEEYTTMSGTGYSEQEYPQAEYKKRKLIDRLTSQRIKQFETVPEEVKQLMFALLKKEAEGAEVASVGVGGNSVSYVTGVETEDSLIKSYLSDLYIDDIPVLYVGV